MPRNSTATGPTVGLPAAYLPAASMNAAVAAQRTAYRAVVAATERVVPTTPRAGHPIVEGWDATLHEVVRTQP